MLHTEILQRGRSGFERHTWSEAYAALSEADREQPLGPEDLQRLAVASYLVGEDEAAASAWERAHQICLDQGDVAGAVRCAFWLAFGLLSRGETALGGGWLGRAHRLVDEHGLDGAERGYLLVPSALGALAGGDPTTAYEICRQAAEVGERFGEPDLVTLGRLGQGQSLTRMGRTAEGIALLDEAMVSVTAEDVSPVVAGTVYCAVILVCREVYDLRRAQEWTSVLNEWCDAQPDMVPFRGQCLVHRSEILQLHGSWDRAVEEAERASERLADPPGQPALGMAHYQRAELYRLRGHYSEAERAYRRASRCGREPQPGLALLRLARGQTGAAAAMVRRLAGEAHTPGPRAVLLSACVEILLAAGDADGARRASDELTAMAGRLDAATLHASAAAAAAAVRLAEGDARAALDSARQACALWQELDAPWDHARSRVVVAIACRELGDAETSDLEVESACDVFRKLGASPELARIDGLFGTQPARADGLTGREIEVLALVSAGKTNRAIARELVVSEHTIRRHLQNIFVKIGVSSRAAASVYAVEHGLC